MVSENTQGKTGWWVGGSIILIAVLLIVVKSHKENTNLANTGTNQEIVDSCTTDMATEFHIHPLLDIIINGQKQVIPADIGITNGCMHPLHTHDTTGKIHVESPVKRDFTLGDFFHVWGKTFTKNEILGYRADDSHIIRQTINGIESTDFENTILRDGDQIVITYEEIK